MLRLLPLLCFVLALAPLEPLKAGTSDPGAPAATFVKAVSSDVLTLLQSADPAASGSEDRLKALLEASVDLKGVGRFVVDRHWQRATAAQREEYHRLFSDYVMSKLIRALRDNPVRDISVVSWSAPSKGDTAVRTLVLRSNADSLDWTWRVRKSGRGYQAVDLISSGVSLAKTLRAEFRSYVDANGFDALLRQLRGKRG